jgi:hypothetical protein
MKPSEDDLNSLFKAWTVPPFPDSLEGRLRRAYRDRTGSRSRRWFRTVPGVCTRWVSGLAPATGMFAGITAGAVVFVLVIAEAFPQSFAGLSGTRSPFTVEYEEIVYKADGSFAIRELFTSAGGGLVLSSEFPGDPMRTVEHRILDPLNLILYWIATPVRERQVARAEARIDALRAKNPVLMAKRMAEWERTCIPGSPWTAAGDETILNYATEGIQKVWMEEGKPVRLTEWSAPDLHCVTLKSTTEKTFEDGRMRLAFERRALKVTMNASATGVRRPGVEPMTHPER